MTKTVADVQTLVTQLVPRAADLTTNRLVGILNYQVKQDLENDLIAEYADTMVGEVTLETPTIGAPTVAEGAGAGSVGIGTYEYRVTFVIDGKETSGGKASTPLFISTGSNDIDLTGIPTGATGTTARKIYRRQSKTGTYKLVATISDNTTTTYTDTTDQTSLSVDLTGQDLPTDFEQIITIFNGETRYAGGQSGQNPLYVQDYFKIDYGNDPVTIEFHPDKWGANTTTLKYRTKIEDVTSGGNLTYPAALHNRLLPVLALGAGFYYLLAKPGNGDDDQVLKVQARYEAAKAEVFDNGGVR